MKQIVIQPINIVGDNYLDSTPSAIVTEHLVLKFGFIGY